eukprot:3251657-Prymnesium_polylepis.2
MSAGAPGAIRRVVLIVVCARRGAAPGSHRSRCAVPPCVERRGAPTAGTDVQRELKARCKSKEN